MSSPQGLVTIQCPNCKRSLPPKMTTCHFCGASLDSVARPQAVAKKRVGPEPWIMTLYYVLAGYWVLNGLWGIGSTVYTTMGPHPAMHGIGFFGGFDILIGAISIAIGIGLMLKWELARGAANIFSWLIIADVALSFLSLVGIGMLFGAGIMVLVILFNVIRVVAAGTQIWLISETEDYF